jgi:hypothetical protein
MSLPILTVKHILEVSTATNYNYVHLDADSTLIGALSAVFTITLVP